jgi:chromosome segregation ATPase
VGRPKGSINKVKELGVIAPLTEIREEDYKVRIRVLEKQLENLSKEHEILQNTYNSTKTLLDKKTIENNVLLKQIADLEKIFKDNETKMADIERKFMRVRKKMGELDSKLQ